MDKTIAQATVSVDQEGYLTDFSQWNKEIGTEIAKEQGIEMTDKHWAIIDYIQQKFKEEEPLSIRGIKKSGVIDIKEFYALFPGGPLKKATMIAGIPKPKSCI
ncbi:MULTISPECIES: TusE/DsrC/DsvC family sulfur relay protein [Flagellimonas]|uniref:TusE/DsrC/DsvC family sulfur relay protein n=2 Tax=Flagellimonas TaxID=444459 RepID=A0A3A1NLS8_9FLAO|nr:MULTISPECIES: TusE/DsrC/DsvC family sulfur relay protein [Allomuricauda]RIV47232.1 TusE/DsrC/DsvC family sulfur relay protein [Allomuricauda maritima]RIV67411.1 TusE/DsrC/DsvC family sulfur relay protein [Allomuricauda aequoris]TXJ99233.1 TusE/DsrC/DsvC family sulfur relay protein [Allomuricauda aequoris]TXK00933.1 TusE/DsrC/DsvC family sulfur relay protein [Allomuricauda maritima]